MTSPNPLRLRARLGPNQSSRLGIVDHDHFFFKLHALEILLVVHQEDFLRILGQFIFSTVQGVVKSFRDFKEVVAAGNDLPMSGDFEL